MFENPVREILLGGVDSDIKNKQYYFGKNLNYERNSIKLKFHFNFEKFEEYFYTTEQKSISLKGEYLNYRNKV